MDHALYIEMDRIFALTPDFSTCVISMLGSLSKPGHWLCLTSCALRAGVFAWDQQLIFADPLDRVLVVDGSLPNDGSLNRLLGQDDQDLLEVCHRWGRSIVGSFSLTREWKGIGVPDGFYYSISTLNNAAGKNYSGHETLAR